MSKINEAETSENENTQDQDNMERYYNAAHAVQAAIGFEIDARGVHASGSSPKHLRTGLNTTKAEHGALVKLLIDKGVFTNSEYLAALADGMEREAAECAKNTIKATGMPETTKLI